MTIHRQVNATRGVLYAALLGIIVPLAGNGIISIVSEAPLDFKNEWAVFLFQCIIIFLPFFLISAAGVSTLLSWTVGLVLTLSLWGYALADALLRRGTGTGANIGLGLMVIASPVVISVVCLAVGRYSVGRLGRG